MITFKKGTHIQHTGIPFYLFEPVSRDHAGTQHLMWMMAHMHCPSMVTLRSSF